MTIEVNEYNSECTRVVLHIYEGFTWYIITIIVPNFGYTCGSVVNGRILKRVFIASGGHLFSLSSYSISNAASCHVTQITAVCCRRSNENISFHLLRPAHESRTDGGIAHPYIST